MKSALTARRRVRVGEIMTNDMDGDGEPDMDDYPE